MYLIVIVFIEHLTDFLPQTGVPRVQFGKHCSNVLLNSVVPTQFIRFMIVVSRIVKLVRYTPLKNSVLTFISK